MKNKKYFLTSLLALAVTACLSYGFVDGSVLKTNLLGAFNNYVLDIDENLPDLGISNVYLTKVASPANDFPYYKYKATVTIRNYGGVYEDASLVLNAGEGQKTAYVRNSIEGFKLEKGDVFTFEDYELLVDGKVNYAEVTFSLESKAHRDNDPSNDSFKVSVFEEPASLGTLSVNSFDGEDVALESLFSMKFKDALSNSDKEICSFDVGDKELDGLRYAEVDTAADVFSYYKIKISKEILFNENLSCEKNFDVKSGESFRINFKDGKVYFLRSPIDENRFALSNAVMFPKQEFMTREEFAKNFVEWAEVPQISNEHYYLDVESDSPYAPFVQAMYDNGLTKESMALEDKSFSFEREKIVTRADVLEPLLNYFDVDLIEGDGAPHFSDVKSKSKNYYFVEAVYADGKGRAFSQTFSPEKRASTAFLKYLINEFGNE